MFVCRAGCPHSAVLKKNNEIAQSFYLLFKGGGFLRSKKTEDCIRAIRESPLLNCTIFSGG